MSTLPVVGKEGAGFDMLDLGANAENKPEHLLQYGILGSFMHVKSEVSDVLVSHS